jgi:hypothetical protein
VDPKQQQQGRPNPFGGGGLKPTPHEDVKDICPFMGFTSVPVPVSRTVIAGDPRTDIQIMNVFQPCVEDRCTFWSESAGTCRFKAAMDNLAAVKDGLKPLEKFLGA